MSKSVGNVVDPITSIDEYGADALRYTLATGTTMGQDLNLVTEKVLSSRNFANKLWNAGKFIILNLQDGQSPPDASEYSSADSLARLPLTERWVISALHQVVNRSTAAHDKLELAEAGRLLYEFFWGDFADWYIEAAKARLYGDNAEAAMATRGVLLYGFDTVLRLAHPFMPFITEELWQALPHSGPALVVASWPAEGLIVDTEAIEHFEEIQATVRGIRNARAEYGVTPGRRIPVTVVVERDSSLRKAIEAESTVVCTLAKLDAEAFNVTAAAPADDAGERVTLVITDAVQVVLPLAGLFDPAKEIERLTRQQLKLSKELGGLAGRLTNQRFLEKAAPEVVAQAQQQQADLQDQIAAVEGKLQQMKSLAASTA